MRTRRRARGQPGAEGEQRLARRDTLVASSRSRLRGA